MCFHNVFVTKMLVTNLRVRIGEPDPLQGSRRPSRRAASRASRRATTTRGTSLRCGTPAELPPSPERPRGPRATARRRDRRRAGPTRATGRRARRPMRGIESVLGPTAAPPTRVGHLPPPARRAVEEFGRRVNGTSRVNGHGRHELGAGRRHGVAVRRRGPSITSSGQTKGGETGVTRDAGGDGARAARRSYTR